MVRAQVGKPIEDKELQDTEIMLCLKNSRKYIASKLWSCFQDRFKKSSTHNITTSTTDAFYEIDLPSDFIADLAVVNGGYLARRIDYGNITAVDSNSYLASSTIQPIYYIAVKEGIRPATEGLQTTLYYVATPTEFSDNTTDESVLAIGIPEEYQMLVIWRACVPLQVRFNLKQDYNTLVENEIAGLLAKKVKDIKGREAIPQ